MTNKTKKIIINTIIVISLVLILILVVHSIKTIKETQKRQTTENIYEYLTNTYKNTENKSSSPLLGFLNYNFEYINPNLSIQSIVNLNLATNSIMNSTGVDNIYKSIYGLTKTSYLNSNRYVKNPNTNCYYYQNELKKSNFNCDSVCSKSTKEIMNSIQKTLSWDNVLPEDAKTYCIKNALYSIENNSYFVSISQIKKMFSELTNKELILPDSVNNNKYAKYDGDLVSNFKTIKDNIKEVTSVDEISENNNEYIVDYTAITDNNVTLKGTLKLGKNDTNYYLISNKINTNYKLN